MTVCYPIPEVHIVNLVADRDLFHRSAPPFFFYCYYHTTLFKYTQSANCALFKCIFEYSVYLYLLSVFFVDIIGAIKKERGESMAEKKIARRASKPTTDTTKRLMIVSTSRFPKEKRLSLQKRLPLPAKASTLLSTEPLICS